MTLTVSPALTQVESALKVSPGSFAKNNYRSVFDIANTSRKQFIADNMSWLGLRGGRAWDLAIGQAQHIRRLFREKQLTRQIRTEVQRRTLSGQKVRNDSASSNIQGLVQDGPTWQNQFAENWQSYCQSGAPEAVDSPVSYLTWLYKQALNFEEEIQASSTAEQVITLADRRPDLATLTVDNDAVNQQIPALQLVNEILENNIATSLPAEQSVDKTLAGTRYPTLLPYHFPHDQVELSLHSADVQLEEIIGQAATDWPWFLNDSWQGIRSNTSTELASRLAPEQQTLVTEADNSTASDLTNFYKTNLGVETSDYTPFENLDTFTRQLGITVPQAEALVAGNGEGSTGVVISPNIAAFVYGDLAFTGAEVAYGRFGNALSLYNREDSYAKFIAGTGAATLLNGDNPFSVSMWINVSAQPTDNQVPIICNCLMDSGNQGIRLCINSGDFLLGVTDSTKTGVDNAKKKKDGSETTISYGQWYLVCLTWDSTNKKATVYYQAEGECAVSAIEVDASTLTGDITTAEGFTWVLNDSGDVSYYKKHPEPNTLVNCLYDDIGIFAGTLSEEDFRKILSADIPLLGLSSQLSMPVQYYYSMDSNFASSYAYGASFINENVRPSVAISYESKHSGYLSLPKGGDVIDGVFGQGIQLDSIKKQGAYLDGGIFSAMTKDVTLAFWFKVNSDIPVNALLGGNIEGESIRNKGISLSVNSYNGKNVLINLSDGKTSQDNSYSLGGIAFDSWNYVALAYSAADKKLTFYRGGQGEENWGVGFDVSNFTTLSSDDGKFWFNGNSDDAYYQANPSSEGAISYDDIAVWERCLTADDINIILKSTLPVAQIAQLSDYVINIDFNSFTSSLSNLSDARMDRINRMVRLQRWLGLSYEENDLLLSACIRAQGADNTDFSLNAHTLRALGVFRHWQEKYGVTAFQFAAVLNEITPYAISPAVPFFDQVFNSPSLFDEPFAITGETVSYADLTGDSARTVRQICAGLEITQAQFRVLADRVAAEQGNAGAQSFPLTLDVVSAFYRLVMVPRWLGLSFADGAALLGLAGEGDKAWTTLAGVPQLAVLTDGQPAGGDILDLLMALDAAAGWAADHKLSWVKSWLALQPGTDALVATSATVNFVNGIKQQLPTAQIKELGINGLPITKSGFLSVCGGSTPVSSPLGAAHGTQLESTLGQYATFSSVANTLANGDTSYTIGMWVKITSGQTNIFPVLTNAAAYDMSACPGIAVYNGGALPHRGTKYQLYVSVVTDEAEFDLGKDDTGLHFDSGNWFWLAIATDVVQKSVTVYAWAEDGTITSSATLNWTGSLIMESDNVWALSQNGVLNQTATPDVTIAYDDVTLWDSVLTVDDIAAIVASGKPATKILPATLTDSDIFSDLIDDNGLVLPAASDYEAISERVTADIDNTGINFASEAEREQAISTLSGIIWQARQAQNGIADSALAQMFGTAQSLPPFLLQWAGDSEYRLLSDSLAMNGGAALTDPSQVPAAYLTSLFALGQRAGISTAFTLTPATLNLFLAHPAWFGVSDTALTLTLLYRFSRYGDWLKVAGDEDRVLAYLSWVNGSTPPDATQAAEALALLLEWESSEVADATAALPGAMAKTTADVDHVMRLQQLSAETGLSVTPLLATGELVPGGVRETWDAWQSAGESLVAAQAGQ